MIHDHLVVPFVLVVRVLGVGAVVRDLGKVEVAEQVVHGLVEGVDGGLEGLTIPGDSANNGTSPKMASVYNEDT